VKLHFRRVLFKLSGELLGSRQGPVDRGALSFFAQEVATARDAGAQLALVVGGGNIVRGSALQDMPLTAGHTMGMLGTLINGVALREALQVRGIPCVLQSSLSCPGVADPVDPWRAREALAQGQVVVFAGGTGNPYVTTDTAAVIRALSVEAQALLKGSKVAGLYEADPLKSQEARPIPRLSHREYLARGLKAMDEAAVAIAGEHNLPIVVFKADETGALLLALKGKVGSLIA